MDKNLQDEFKTKATLSAKDLIAKKGLIEKKKTKNINLEVSGLGLMTFRTPSTEDLMDANEYSGRSQDYLIFNCSVEPNLRNKELQDAFEAEEPVDIVNKVFLPGEISELAERLTESAGFNDKAVKLVDDLKN